LYNPTVIGTLRHSMDEHAIVPACAKGDSHALRSLHERHARAAYTFALCLLGKLADADDAAAQPWPQGSRDQAILVAAPGVDLWLPVGGGRYFTGTSYAAPFAAAWIARRLARGQPADAAALCATAQDLPPAGRDDATGCGYCVGRPSESAIEEKHGNCRLSNIPSTKGAPT
jgi:hypothetical protein